jgi:hypothetical protein
MVKGAKRVLVGDNEVILSICFKSASLDENFSHVISKYY